ncbi:MAG: polyphosphate kinase 2 family protein [Armatimonadota bacterium]|nr:polyphosphate kinase 2 family protein [Armatimonadota bacterium]
MAKATKKNSSAVVVEPGQKIRLRDIDPDATGSCDSKEESLERLAQLNERSRELQEAFYAEHRQSLLIVLQAMDTGGKDGALKSMIAGFNPIGVRINSFKKPTPEELDHDFLWRVHECVPAKSYVGIWNRSHYEDVLIVRVHGWIDKNVCQQRYEDINNFEQMLSRNGVTILKFYLHISKDEQRERLEARLEDPTKHWKFNPADLEERKLWDEYQKAYEDAINHCSTPHAPWIIVPANRKWARNLALAETIVATLESLKPQYPQAGFDPQSIVIE